MVPTNIQKGTMETRLKHEFEIIYLRWLERRGGCRGIPKLVVLLVLVIYFFLITSCLSYQLKKYSPLHDTPMPTKWLVLQTNDTIVSIKKKTQVIIGRPFYSKRKCNYKRKHSFYFVLLWESFND